MMPTPADLQRLPNTPTDEELALRSYVQHGGALFPGGSSDDPAWRSSERLLATLDAARSVARDERLDMDDVRSIRETVRGGTDALTIVFPVIQALRTWRDAENTPKHPRAIQEAENAVLTELRYFEDRADFLRSAALEDTP